MAPFGGQGSEAFVTVFAIYEGKGRARGVRAEGEGSDREGGRVRRRGAAIRDARTLPDPPFRARHAGTADGGQKG
jgi:hypothetical protein